MGQMDNTQLYNNRSLFSKRAQSIVNKTLDGSTYLRSNIGFNGSEIL